MIENNKKLTLTNILIAITFIVYFIQISIPNGSLWLGLNIYFFTNQLYYQVLSSIFTHGSMTHIVMNMFVLWQFGNFLEIYIGKIKFLVIYIIGGILTSAGTLAYMYYFDAWANVVGASGAISVLFGFIALRSKQQRTNLITWIMLMSFVPLLFGMHIAWYSHLIGFVIGFLMGFII